MTEPVRLDPDQIRRRLIEIGGADGHGAIIPLQTPTNSYRTRFVRIRSNDAAHLGLDSILVFVLKDDLWLRNVGLDKPAAMSTTFDDAHGHHATLEFMNGDASALTEAGPGQWWQVDLLTEHEPSHIVLYNGCAFGNFLTYHFDVQVSRDGEHWDTVYRNNDLTSAIHRIRQRVTDERIRLEELAPTTVVGQTASHDPTEPFDHARSLAFLQHIADELAIELANLTNDRGGVFILNEHVDRIDQLRQELLDNWATIWPQSLDFPSPSFPRLELAPADGLPRSLTVMWPEHTVPRITTKDGTPIALERFGISLENGLPKACYTELRDKYHGQNTHRFQDGWWWWYADLSELDPATSLILENAQREPSYGESWQVWGSNDLLNWNLVYDHGGVLDVFHRLLNVIWRFTRRSVKELQLLMCSMSLQQRPLAGWLPARAYVIDDDANPEELQGFHEFLEEANSHSTLRLPVLMTKHGFYTGMKYRDKPEYTKAMVLIADELKRSFDIDALVWYGSLLGLVREGDYIDHDDDVDMIYFSKATNMEDVMAEREQIIALLQTMDAYDVDMHIWPGRNFHAVVKTETGDFEVDLFPAWIENGEVQLWHDRLKIFRGFDADNIFPLKTFSYAGFDLLGPSEPEAILEDLYGQNWRTPMRSYGHALQIDQPPHE